MEGNDAGWGNSEEQFYTVSRIDNDGDWPNIGEFDIMEYVDHEAGEVLASAHSKDYEWQTGTQQKLCR